MMVESQMVERVFFYFHQNHISNSLQFGCKYVNNKISMRCTETEFQMMNSQVESKIFRYFIHLTELQYHKVCTRITKA